CEKVDIDRVFCGYPCDEIYSEIAAPSIFLLCRRHPFSSKKFLGAHFHAEAHISTESPPPLEDPRVSQPHENEERSCSSFAPSCQGPQARFCECRIPRLSFSARCSLRVPASQKNQNEKPCRNPLLTGRRRNRGARV